jgi:RND superfamily putative drug exporter
MVLGVWVAVLVASIALAQSVGTKYSNNFTLPGTESLHAYDILHAVAPVQSGDIEQIVFEAKNGASISDPQIQQRISATLLSVWSLKYPHLNVQNAISSPIVVHSMAAATWRVLPEQISRDGTIAYATVTFNLLASKFSQADASAFVKAATSQSHGDLLAAVTGQLAEQANRPAIGGLPLGIIAAFIVLILVFGSLFAALMPLGSAIVALGTAISLIGILSHIQKMPEFAPQLVALIGLGVGVDYALFIVSRHRQGLIEGKSVESSIVQAVNTSGRAVLFAGIIVCIALLGMFALQVNFLEGLAIASSIGVAFTMFAALTLLPAMLSFVGTHILSRRQRKLLKLHGPHGAPTRGFWTSWSEFVDRRPVIPAVTALLIILLLAAPFLSIRLGFSDQGNDAIGTPTRTAYDLLAKGFGPGFNGPLDIVAVQTSATQTPVLAQLGTNIAHTPGVAAVFPPVSRLDPQKPATTVVLMTVIPTSAPQDAATTDLINKLRGTVIPDSLSGTNMTVLVGGVTATFADFSHVLAMKLPLFIGLVVFTSFLLLAVVFRSLVVPLVSAVMNLLSIGAALGILVAVFQWGWFGGLFGVNRPGPVEAFLPVMLFAILFGLSMDYQVFLVSRMHEEWLRHGDNRTAVRLGLARTGKTITAAAFIMIVVFASFILGGQRIIKEFGIGLAGGVLVDAIVIRMAIVPAVMILLGKSNWWFPRWLDRSLPRLGLEDPDELAIPDVLAEPEPAH